MSFVPVEFVAWGSFAANLVANALAERKTFGLSNRECSKKYDSLITPNNGAFAIWGFIFLGEALGLAYVALTAGSSFNVALRAFSFGMAFQTLWCVAFSRELLLMSAVLLALIAYHLEVTCSDLARTELPLVGQLVLALPLRVHWAWAVAATAVNVNVWIGSLRLPGLEVWTALQSVWLAAMYGCYRATFHNDAVFPMVLLWAFAWMSDKIKQSPPTSTVHDYSLLDLLETTYDVLVLNMWGAGAMSAALTGAFWYLQWGPYSAWIAGVLARHAGASETLLFGYLFFGFTVANVLTLLSKRGPFVWQ